MKPTFLNKSGLEFEDISSESWREYLFSDGNVVRIDSPQYIHVSEQGHRVFDGNANSHYIPNKWIHLVWNVKQDNPHFVL